MSILEYNGGCVVAMVGKDCVGIATDLRFGVQAQTISCNFSKVHKLNQKFFYHWNCMHLHFDPIK